MRRISHLSRFAYGRGDRTRTCGILVPNQALYQTELHLATVAIIFQITNSFIISQIVCLVNTFFCFSAESKKMYKCGITVSRRISGKTPQDLHLTEPIPHSRAAFLPHRKIRSQFHQYRCWTLPECPMPKIRPESPASWFSCEKAPHNHLTSKMPANFNSPAFGFISKESAYDAIKVQNARYVIKTSSLETTSNGACIDKTGTPTSMVSISRFAI